MADNGKLSAKQIAGMLSREMFHFRRYLLVSNVSWGLLPWEADLLAMTGSGYVSEIEIKISIADLKRDKAKRKFLSGWKSFHDTIKARWYAMPLAVWEHKDAAEAVPADAGVVVVETIDRGEWKGSRRMVDRLRVIREPAANPSARPLTDSEQFQLARLGCMRHWAKLARESMKENRNG